MAEAGSVSRAAERLGYTQSAVSQQIRSLERIVGVELLVRAPGARHVQLTDPGHRLLAHAAAIRERLAAAQRDLSAYADDLADVVRLGTIQSAARTLVSPLAVALRAQAPQVVLHVEESYRSDVLLRRLGEGDLDLVLAAIVDDVAGLEATEVLQDAYVLVVPAADPLTRLGRPLRVDDLAGRALVAKDCGIPTQRVLTAALARLDVEMETVVRAHDGETVQQLVADGVGVSVMPQLLVDQGDPRVRVVPLGHLLPPRRIGLYERADGYRAPAVAIAASAIRAGAAYATSS